MIARPSPNNTKLPPAPVLRDLVNQGYGRNQIAAMYGVSLDHARKALKECGIIAPRSRDPNAHPPTPIMTLYVDGRPVNLPRVSMITNLEKYA
jgi:hypothetical protein